MKTFTVTFKDGTFETIKAFDVVGDEKNYRFYSEPDENNMAGDTIALLPASNIRMVHVNTEGAHPLMTL